MLSLMIIWIFEHMRSQGMRFGAIDGHFMFVGGVQQADGVLTYLLNDGAQIRNIKDHSLSVSLLLSLRSSKLGRVLATLSCELITFRICISQKSSRSDSGQPRSIPLAVNHSMTALSTLSPLSSRVGPNLRCVSWKWS